MRALVIGLALLSAAPAAAQQPAAEAADPATEPRPKLICRQGVETGSLVRSKKVCRTAKDWRIQQEASQNMSRKMQRTFSGERGN